VLIKIIAASTITLIGIYGCSMPVGLLPTTATCYKISSFSAPAEWILALCWITYLFAVGYDLYHAEHVAQTIIARSDRRVHHAKSPSAAMRSLRLAKVLEHDYKGSERMKQDAVPLKSKYASVEAQELTEGPDDDEHDMGMVDDSRWSRRVNKEFV
jgi:hypothetical protein